MRPHTAIFLLFLSYKITAQVTRLPLSMAHNAGIGDATAAWRGYEAVFANPAGMSDVKHARYVFASAWQFGLKELQPLALAAIFPTASGVVAVRSQYFRYQTYREWGFGLLFAKKIMEKMNIGVSLDYANLVVQGTPSVSDVGLSLGFNYLIIKNLHAGFWVKNPVTLLRADENSTPSVFHTGFSYQIVPQCAVFMELRKNDRTPVNFAIGFNYAPTDKITVRVGVMTQTAQFSFGIGYNFSPKMKANAAVVSHPNLGMTPSIDFQFCPKCAVEKAVKTTDRLE